MKRILLPLLATLAFSSTLLAQDTPAPSVRLSTFEKCNNWTRHYCKDGAHERTVNQQLMEWKKRGIIITTRLIKKAAREAEN